MEVLIVQSANEDADKLRVLLGRFDRDLSVVGEVSDVAEAVDWLTNNPAPELMLCEAILQDSTCFDILRHIRITFPVIFTGDPQQALSIGLRNLGLQFLPLPADQEVLKQLLDGYFTRRNNGTDGNSPVSSLDKLTGFRKRFLVRHGRRWLSVSMDDIAWFHSEDKVCTIRTWDRRRYIIDFTLDELAQMIDPTQYFRVNRNYILHVDSIKSFAAHFGGRLILETEPVAEGEQILVSQEKAQKFKVWLGK